VRAGKKRYLDVWPVNFLTAEDTDVTDNTSLFLFQLACIVNMVSFLVSLSSVSYITSLLIVTPHRYQSYSNQLHQLQWRVLTLMILSSLSDPDPH
jgi:hypothetical protein